MNDCRSTSPSSDILSDGIDSLSVRNKSLLKRSVSKHHNNNNNCKAGYIPVHEQDFKKVGLKGRKTFAFWTLVFLLFILAFGNLILTIVILGVLGLGQGMESLELIPDEQALKFMGATDLGNIYKRDGRLEGFLDVPVEIVSENGSLIVKLAIKYGRSLNKLKVDNNGTTFEDIDEFEVKNRKNDVVFSTNSGNFINYKNLNNISTKMVETNRIVSPLNKPLKMDGSKYIYLRGAEGTNLESKKISWTADQDIHLEARSVLINSSNVIIADTVLSKHSEFSKAHYKVCICMPQGKLFKLRLQSPNDKIFCNQVASNPCM